MGEPSFLGDAHFSVGCVCVVSGLAAFAARKGTRVHRAAGQLFVATMALLTASGLWLSIARDILFTVFLSALAFHAFVSGWGAVISTRPLGQTIERAAPFVSALIAIGALCGGLCAAATPEGLLNDLPPAAFYAAAGISGVMCVLDTLFALKRPRSEQRRLTRHLWRMGFSFFLATGIFFFGNNHVLPAALRTPLFLSAPVLAVIIWTALYALRTRFGLFEKNLSAPVGGHT
ncbi:MAG: hypothetical protein AAF608_01200 [Pseudomonadota bacterium]